MDIFRIWIITIGGRQLFLKEFQPQGQNPAVETLSAGVIHGFLIFLKEYIASAYPREIVFEEGVHLTFDYMTKIKLPFITIVGAHLSANLALDAQRDLLARYAHQVSTMFYEEYRDCMQELSVVLGAFDPFAAHCEEAFYLLLSDPQVSHALEAGIK